MPKIALRVCISPVHPLMLKKTRKPLIFFSCVRVQLIRLSLLPHRLIGMTWFSCTRLNVSTGIVYQKLHKLYQTQPSLFLLPRGVAKLIVPFHSSGHNNGAQTRRFMPTEKAEPGFSESAAFCADITNAIAAQFFG